jgi:hypothetical protein
MCTSILPGPKEQNPDEIQRFLRPIVSDLLRLWKEGITVPTESRPQGTRIPNDAPYSNYFQDALYVSSSLRLYATNQQHIKSGVSRRIHTLTSALSVGYRRWMGTNQRLFVHKVCPLPTLDVAISLSPFPAFRARTNEEHRRLGDQYRELRTPYARAKFVKDYATRYTQLSRLPYFNLVEQIVIDPMHNLFLGMSPFR